MATTSSSIRLVVARDRVVAAIREARRTIERRHPHVPPLTRQLAALDPDTVTKEAADAAGLHPSWWVVYCDGCGDAVPVAVDVGMDRDEPTEPRASLCPSCVREAFALLPPEDAGG